MGWAWGVMHSLDLGVWRCRYLCSRMKALVFRSLLLPVLLYGCVTSTLTSDLRWRVNSFRTRSLHSILGDPWLDFLSNERLLRETQMRFLKYIVHEHQLRLIFLMLILLTRFSQQGSLVIGGGQQVDHVPPCCNRLTGISRRGDGRTEVPVVPAESEQSLGLPKQSYGLLGTLMDGSPLRHKIVEWLHRPSQLVLILLTSEG